MAANDLMFSVSGTSKPKNAGISAVAVTEDGTITVHAHRESFTLTLEAGGRSEATLTITVEAGALTITGGADVRPVGDVNGDGFADLVRDW